MSVIVRLTNTLKDAQPCPGSAKVFTSGGIDYYIDQVQNQPSALPLPTLLSGIEGDLLPATVIDWTKDQFGDNDLDQIIADFALKDDVWTRDFLAVLIIRTSRKVLVNVGQPMISIFTEATFAGVSNGPYAIRRRTGEIYSVSRLFEDKYNAFIGGGVRVSSDVQSFEWLHIDTRTAVPSRLYYDSDLAKPLAGLRFAVKDTIDVAGLESGYGNRDYRNLYGPRTSSAQCIQQLVNAGAILVGKTHTSQFAEGEAPRQWLDYVAPFNPRGDSHQKPSSSSTGSAVASAAYTWLDFAIGTDTGGSTRHPAGVCGTYGLRASTKAVSSAGIYSVAPLLDSIGIFARSAVMVEAVFKSMADPSYLSLASLTPKTRYKLLYPVQAKGTKPVSSYRWFPCPGEPSEATVVESHFENVVQQLESYLRCQRLPFNIDDLWRETRPAGQRETLDEATGEIYTVLSTYTCVQQTIDPFIANYKAENNGRSPSIDPVVKARQDHGRQYTRPHYEAAVQSATTFSQWVKYVLLAKSEEDELPLLIFPQSWGRPDYREDPDLGPLFFHAFSMYSLSYLSGSPDCTIPIGELSSQSRITESKMLLPFSLSILSPPGTDLALLNLLTQLEAQGILKPVSTGSSMYTG